MPVPVNENITLNVVTTVDAVTGITAERHDRKAATPAHMLAIIHEGADEKLGDDETPCGFSAWVRSYGVQVYIFQQDLADGVNFHTTLNTVRADIEKALMADVTRGGYAHNTEIQSPQEFVDSNDATGVVVFFDVTYRTDQYDPYEPAP